MIYQHVYADQQLISLPECCSCCSAEWSSASLHAPAPHSADWAPPDASPASSPAAQTTPQARTEQDGDPEETPHLHYKLLNSTLLYSVTQEPL